VVELLLVKMAGSGNVLQHNELLAFQVWIVYALEQMREWNVASGRH
jgi:hypothetical protein